MISAATREVYEAQAYACLEAAALHRENLLAVAVRLAGSQDGGMELFQQTCLNCHDAIQSKGFVGERYEFYLLRALKNLHSRKAREPEFVSFPADLEISTASAPVPDSYGFLAELVQAEIKQQFKLADRIAFRLHVQGLSCQDIADAIGRRDRSWVWRRLERMKATLRETFGQAWRALGE